MIASTTVVTDHGEFAGRDVVFALGAWSPLLARQLDLRIPIQPGKGYSITYSRPVRCPKIPLTLKERAVCVTGWNSGFGSAAPWNLPATIRFAESHATGCAAARCRRIPARSRRCSRSLEEWYGWRPMTYDDLPILGRVSRLQNLLLATGHGMLGVTMSAATGLLVREMICGEPLSLDAAPMSPARFTI